jgi:protein involved in polysaccharide export with SLBB domain
MKQTALTLTLLLAGNALPLFAQSMSHPGTEAGAESAAESVVADTNSMDALDDHRPLAAGDVLSYRVVQERFEPRPIQVTDSGEVEIPLIGRIPAAGKTCRELAVTIKSELEKEYFWPGHATVILGLDAAAKTRGRVLLTGEVRTQGSEDIPPTGDFTVTKAILQAGGFGDFADEHRVSVQRKMPDGTSRIIRVDVARVLKGATQGDLALQPEDIIMIPAKVVNF